MTEQHPLTGEEGAMAALRRTLEENHEAMRILAMGDKEEMEDAIDTLLALEREKDGYEPITLDELAELDELSDPPTGE